MDEAAYDDVREEPGLRTAMRYLPLTDADRRDMLAAIGATSIDELFRDVPASARLAAKIAGLPDHQGELEVERAFQAYAAKNLSPSAAPFFIGAGAYRHHVPATVDYMIQRGEFLTVLHALPARDHAGHAAVSVRVPDPGGAAHRHGGGQRLDV